MRSLQTAVCILLCLGVLIVFGVGIRKLADDGRRAQDDRSAQPAAIVAHTPVDRPGPRPHALVVGASVDRHAIEVTSLVDRLAEANRSLARLSDKAGAAPQDIQDALAERLNDICMLHLLAAKSPQTAIPEEARHEMRAVDQEQSCGKP